MTEGLIETYLSTLQALWPNSPEPRLHRSRGSGRSSSPGSLGFYVMPGPAAPRMLVPAGSPAAAARSMQRFSAGLSVPDVAKRLGVAAALRGRSDFVLPHRIEVEDSAGSLREWLGDVLGEPVQFSMALGPARANRKPVLQVFDARGRSLAFAKVGATPLAETHVAAEVGSLTVLGERGVPASLEVPRLVHAGRWQGCLVLVMTALEPSVWQRPSRQWELPRSEMDALHAHFAETPRPLVDLPFWQGLLGSAAGLTGTDVRDRLDAALGSLATYAGQEPLTPGAWHGDWTPWNMARARRRLLLWDWERFELGVPAGLDRCHYGVNAVCRRDGVSTTSVFAGLRLAGIDAASYTDRVTAAAYLASITTRYLVGAESALGETVQDRAGVMLQSLEQWLEQRSRQVAA